jgi:hypothetical protein
MRIAATVKDNGLAERLRGSTNEVKRTVSKIVRSSSFAVEKRIKIDMPVDKGRARASWGHWTPSDIVKAGNWTRKDAHWLERDEGLTIEQGSNVPYIAALNEGTSSQAPLGFIDKAADAGAREMTTEILQEVGDLLQ